MKKTVCVLMAVMLMICCVACGKTTDDSATPSNSESQDSSIMSTEDKSIMDSDSQDNQSENSVEESESNVTNGESSVDLTSEISDEINDESYESNGEETSDAISEDESSEEPSSEEHLHKITSSIKYDSFVHWYICECGEEVEKENHSFGEWKITKESTETQKGEMERSCSECKYKEKTTIPTIAHKHSYTTWMKNDTTHWNECSCGDKANVSNHKFWLWEIVTAVTSSKEGIEARTCVVCRYTETKTIPVLGYTDEILEEECITWGDYVFHTACGEFDINSNGDIETISENSIAVVVNDSFSTGKISAKFVSNGGSEYDNDNGIIFGLEDISRHHFLNQGRSYYFLIVSDNGSLYLAKVAYNDNPWEELKFVHLSDAGIIYSHGDTIEIAAEVLDNGIIKCYANNKLIFTYRDEEPLTGHGYGIRGEWEGVSWKELSVQKY